MMFCFFNDTATTEIYTLSLHDALPISKNAPCPSERMPQKPQTRSTDSARSAKQRYLPMSGTQWSERWNGDRSEEHTSELQSRQYLVCRLLLEKKKIPSTE